MRRNEVGPFVVHGEPISTVHNTKSGWFCYDCTFHFQVSPLRRALAIPNLLQDDLLDMILHGCDAIYPVLTDEDTVYHTSVSFPDHDPAIPLQPGFNIDDMALCAVALLDHCGISVLDFRTGSTGSTGGGLFDEKNNYICAWVFHLYCCVDFFLTRENSLMHMDFSILSHQRMPEDVKKALAALSTYSSVLKDGCHAPLKTPNVNTKNARVRDLELCTWPWGDGEQETIPMTGLFCGEWWDRSKIVNEYGTSAHSPSWNYKTRPTIHSLRRMLSDREKSVRTVSARFRSDSTQFWSLAFGWPTA